MRPHARGREGLGGAARRCDRWRPHLGAEVDAPLDPPPRQGSARRGLRSSANTIARLLRQRGFSVHAKRKRPAEVSDRDRQFRYLSRLRRLYVTLGLPVISVDTKKKELIGPFQNPGRTWRRQPNPVFAHDFPSWAEGRAVPSGIDDVAHNDGLVVVGTSHETPSFAVSCIRRW